MDIVYIILSLTRGRHCYGFRRGILDHIMLTHQMATAAHWWSLLSLGTSCLQMLWALC